MQLGLLTGSAIPNWQFGDLKPFSFGVIMADPAWRYENWSDRGEDRNASQHYQTMTVEEISALRVWELASTDCALLLWTVGPLAHRWHEVMSAWKFKFAGKGFCWAKTNPFVADNPVQDVFSDRTWWLNTGYGTRHNSEDCYLGIKGAPKRLDAGVRELIVAPVREHSRKPDEAYARAQRLFAGPYLDLFSRESRPGWEAWGDQTGKFDSAATRVGACLR